MSKTATVTKVERKESADWNSDKYGQFYGHTVAFDNGDEGVYSSKSENQDKFVVGQNADYEIQDGGNYPDKIKAVQQQGGGGGGRRGTSPEERKGINACNALNNACTLASASIGNMESVGDVLKWADKFWDWLESKSG
jgi:hypothetical protein